MSHPYAPQPYYHTRQGRLHAPVPDPMGEDAAVQANAGYFTSGIFDEEVAMPAYMRERAGINGDGYYDFGGLGTDAAACMSPGDAANQLFDAIMVIGANVPLKGSQYGIPYDLGTLASVLGGLRETLVPELAGALQSGSRSWNEGKDAIIRFLAGKIVLVLPSAVRAIASGLVEAGLRAAAGATLDKFVNINICYGQSMTATEVSVARVAVPITGSYMLQANYMTGAEMLQAAQAAQRSGYFDQVPGGAAPAAAGQSTVLLLGAAALAALYFLR